MFIVAYLDKNCNVLSTWKKTYKQQKTAFFVVKKTVSWSAHRESNPELSLRRRLRYPITLRKDFYILKVIYDTKYTNFIPQYCTF